MRTADGSAVIAGALALLLGIATAQAQTYPTRSIKIVVPATPGGAIDVIARLLGDKLTASMGQSWWSRTSRRVEQSRHRLRRQEPA